MTHRVLFNGLKVHSLPKKLLIFLCILCPINKTYTSCAAEKADISYFKSLQVNRLFGDLLHEVILHGKKLNGKCDSPSDDAWNRRLEIVKLLIRKGSDINARNKHRDTLLHCAAETGHIEIVAFLIESEVDVNAKNSSKETPLHRATACGHNEVALMLIDNGAQIDPLSSSKVTPLHYAVSKCSSKVVGILLNKGADYNAVDHYSGGTPLYYAAEAGHIYNVKILFENTRFLRGIDVNAVAKEAYGGNFSPLHAAVGNQELCYDQVVKFLLEKGADTLSLDFYNRTPLSVALEVACRMEKKKDDKQLLAAVNLLLEKPINVEKKDNGGNTVFERAVDLGNPDVVKALLRKGAMIDSTILLRAARHGSSRGGLVDVMDVLIENGANLFCVDDSGRTALHLAAKNGNTDAVRLFLAKGLSPNETDKDGKTAINYAIKERKWDTARVLVIPKLTSTKYILAYVCCGLIIIFIYSNI